jgi:hypothetical protein
MQTEGSCFCGKIAFDVTIDPSLVVICHCTDCQVLGGSAFRLTCVVKPEDLVFRNDDYTVFAKAGDSGKVRRQVFCPVCGTSICSLPAAGETGGFVSLRAPTLKVRDQLKPRAQIWCRSRASWLPEIATEFSRDEQK